MSILGEFKEFAVRGNVMDMAVGIVVGAAFTQIVNSFVKDVMMPPLGVISGGVDFSNLKLVLREGAAASGAAPAIPPVTLNYGLFINTIINFLIVAFAVFMLVKALNRLKRSAGVGPKPPPAPPPPPPAPPPGPTLDQQLLMDIRDSLRARK